MKKLYTILFITLFIGSACAADKLPDLSVFAKNPQYLDMEISPKGEFLAFTYEEGTQVNLAVMERETKKIISSFEFGENRHVSSFSWVNDDRVEMTVVTRIGWLDGRNQNPLWVAANADGTKRQTLWDFQGSNMRMISRLRNDPKHILVLKSHWSDQGEAKLTRLNVYNAKRKFIAGTPPAARHSRPGIVGVFTGLDDQVRFAYEYDQGEDEVDPDDDKGYLHYKDSQQKWTRLTLPSVRKTRPVVNLIGISADQKLAYFTSNHDMKNADTAGLFQLNFETKSIKLIYRHPDVDLQRGIIGSQNQLVGVYLEPGYPEIHYIENEANKADIDINKSLAGAFKNQFVAMISRTDDAELAVVRVRSDKNPGEFYLFDNKTKKLSYLASSKPEVKASEMAAVEPFSLKARDGLKIFGQLTIPSNVSEKDLPMVVYPHGGPYGVSDRWGWDRRAQMLASRGYLVLQLNFRGSGGYGEDFQNAGETEWGAKMQDDLTDATKWAINIGIADPERICIHGVSYGGYASMNAVVKEPDLYKCSIPDAGVYEMAMQWDKADSFRGPKGGERKDWYMNYAIGGYENVKERSPVYHVDKLKAALLIVHGGADVRVPIDNAYLLEEKLKAAGKPYNVLYKDEEGHGFSKENNRIELYGEILEFLEKHIGPGAPKIKSS
ncbi:MAG: prolyl oligopeptidase family serine peptidase [Kangiellaceae bacterium]